MNPGDEVEGIKHHLAQFLASPATYEAAGRHGRRIVETRHTPQAYVEALIEIARHAPVLHGYRTAIDLARATSRVLSSITDVDGVAHAAPNVAVGIARLMCESSFAAERGRDGRF